MAINKKRITAIICALVIATSFSACAKPKASKDLYVYNAYQGSGQVESNFFGLMPPKHVVDALKEINLFETLDSFIAESTRTGGKIRIVRNENNADSTSVETYYLGKRKICAVYEGYGENVWEMYTEDIDGTMITVKYINSGEDYASVIVTQNLTDKKGLHYSARYEDLDESLPYGAGQITVGYAETKDGFNQEINYSIAYSEKIYNCSLASAYYTDSTGNYCYSYHDEEADKVATSVVCEKVKSEDIKLFDKFQFEEVANMQNFVSYETIVGRHKTYVDENGSLYIKCDLYCVFNYEKSAHALSRLFELEEPDDSYSVDCYSVRIKDVMLKVSADCRAGTNDYIISEYLTEDRDDPDFRSMKFNISNEIYKFNNEHFLACY